VAEAGDIRDGAANATAGYRRTRYGS
jgi:hypothetical protein